jgi:hypothetical protein
MSRSKNMKCKMKGAEAPIRDLFHISHLIIPLFDL